MESYTLQPGERTEKGSGNMGGTGSHINKATYELGDRLLKKAAKLQGETILRDRISSRCNILKRRCSNRIPDRNEDKDEMRRLIGFLFSAMMQYCMLTDQSNDENINDIFRYITDDCINLIKLYNREGECK